MDWYDNINDIDIIKRMKHNFYSFRMLRYMESDLVNLFEQVPLEDLVYLKRKPDTDELIWKTPNKSVNMAELDTFRLRPDWEWPKRKAVIEAEMMELGENLVLTPGIYGLVEKTEGWPEGKYKLTLEEL